MTADEARERLHGLGWWGVEIEACPEWVTVSIWHRYDRVNRISRGATTIAGALDRAVDYAEAMEGALR